MSAQPHSPLRLTAVATHPIQYHAPWYRALESHPDVDLEVVFLLLPDAAAQGEGFARAFQWDVPLLDGYRWHAPGDGVRSSAPRLTQSIGWLRSEFTRRRPEAVLLTGWHAPALLAAPWLARAVGARTMVRGNANLLRPRPAWKRTLQRALLQRYDACLAVGQASRAFFLDAGVESARVVDCPYFVDNAWFRRSASALARSEVRRRFAVPEDALCLLFAGKLEHKKRPLDCIEALQRLAPGTAHLLVVGSGALEPEMRRAARGLPVSFAGFLNQSQMPAAYAAADCLVLPSDHGETWGLVVNEAMACGVPAIVSTQVGCAADLVDEGSTGWLFETDDVDALAGCLRAAASSPARLREFGVRAQRRVFERYTAERAAAAVAEAGLALRASSAGRRAA